MALQAPKPKPRQKQVTANYLNLKRALGGKGTTSGGAKMSASARKTLISTAASRIAMNRDVTEAKAMKILKRRVSKGQNVGGFTKGARRGASEGKKVGGSPNPGGYNPSHPRRNVGPGR